VWPHLRSRGMLLGRYGVRVTLLHGVTRPPSIAKKTASFGAQWRLYSDQHKMEVDVIVGDDKNTVPFVGSESGPKFQRQKNRYLMVVPTYSLPYTSIIEWDMKHFFSYEYS
jgi:hypothetical protein